ncbi:MAG: GNAT family N-acetyltransferase [Fimbriimonadaceae bacterium]|nr:GNAT family N-acetyltransferase [Fimbriimonadaceae bacterium]
MAFGIEGERVRLVPYDQDKHFENFYRWVNDPGVTENLVLIGTPITRESQDEFFKNVHSPDRTYFVIETIDGTHIGGSSIDNIDYRHGKGYGTEAAILRADYAFKQHGLRILKSSYFEGNEGSRRMQAKAGYIEYGRIEDAAWKDGRYRTLIYTYLTSQRFYDLHRK